MHRDSHRRASEMYAALEKLNHEHCRARCFALDPARTLGKPSVDSPGGTKPQQFRIAKWQFRQRRRIYRFRCATPVPIRKHPNRCRSGVRPPFNFAPPNSFSHLPKVPCNPRQHRWAPPSYAREVCVWANRAWCSTHEAGYACKLHTSRPSALAPCR